MLPTKVVINISSETVAIAFLLPIFLACLQQKRKDGTMRALTKMMLTEMFVLSCQIGQWFVLGQLAIGNSKPLAIGKYFFPADFALVSLLMVLFRTYILAHRENLREDAGLTRENHDMGQRLLFLWWLAINAVFTSSIWTGIFYTFDENQYGIFHPMYKLIFIAGLLPATLNTITTLKNRKLFGPKDTCLMLAFILVPSIAVAFDLRLDLCFSYLLTALILVALFIGINVRHNEEMLQKQSELAKSQEEMANMRINLMMAQIQPHFLYNALSSIAYLCTEDPKEAETATNEFASYLKSNLKSINSKEPIPFTEELKHVENYLKIEKRRFTNRIRVVYDIQASDFMVPALALQAIVENAVRHGVETRYEPTTITISTCESGTAFIVTVQDDGLGFDVTAVPADGRLHIGINSTCSRLAAMVNGTLEISSRQNVGTTVTMTIPKEMEG